MANRRISPLSIHLCGECCACGWQPAYQHASVFVMRFFPKMKAQKFPKIQINSTRQTHFEMFNNTKTLSARRDFNGRDFNVSFPFIYTITSWFIYSSVSGIVNLVISQLRCFSFTFNVFLCVCTPFAYFARCQIVVHRKYVDAWSRNILFRAFVHSFTLLTLRCCVWLYIATHLWKYSTQASICVGLPDSNILLPSEKLSKTSVLIMFGKHACQTLSPVSQHLCDSRFVWLILCTHIHTSQPTVWRHNFNA